MKYDNTGALITTGGGGGGSSTVTGPELVSIDSKATATNSSLSSIDGKVPAVAVLADATANPTLTKFQSFLSGFNGTTWDRLRNGIFGAVSSVLGYQNVINVGRYNATPPTLTDGQWINQQLNVNGRLLVGEGLAYRSQATIQRAANTTAYTANDVYGAAFELQNIGTSGGFIILNNFRVIFNISSLPSGMGAMTLYLYDVTPPSAVADNGAFSVPSGDRASLITVEGLVGTAKLAQGGGSVVMTVVDINRVYKLATGSTSLFGYLVTTGAFTPAAVSETATIVAKALGV